MSEMFEKIKNYYDSGLWDESRVRNVVSKGTITDEEFAKIVGKKFKSKL